MKLLNKLKDILYLPSCRGSSIKTRIETNILHFFGKSRSTVAEVVPLKQGLKRVYNSTGGEGVSLVAEVVPLKQGLKRSFPYRRSMAEWGCRGSSIKTRIETPVQSRKAWSY